MEYRINDYQISGNSIVLPRETSIEDIRLIYNETQKILICSTAKKENLSSLGVFVTDQINKKTTIRIPTSICVLMPMDKLTIKCDYGDNLSSVESKVEEVGNNLLGTNKEATNTNILNGTLNLAEMMSAIVSRSVKYDKQTGNLIIENVELIIE